MNNDSFIPAGYHSVTPSLTCKDAVAALKFYQKAFDAQVTIQMDDPKTGGIAHAEFQIGNSTMMLSSEYPQYGSFAPEIGTGGSFMIYVEDCEAAWKKALDAGATSIQEPTDQFWGDRTARFADPHGYRWAVAQKVRDVSPEELEKAAKAWMEENAA